MDPSLFVIMSAAKQEMHQQQIHAENMANSHVLGYKAARSSTQPLYLTGGKVNPRAYIEVNSHAPDLKDGPIEYTGKPLDIALRGNQWLAVATPGGDIGYVHSASLTRQVDGTLTTEMGYLLSTSNGEAIEVGGGDDITIMNNGDIFSRDPLGSVNLMAEIPVYQLNMEEVIRGESGLLVMTGEGGPQEITSNKQIITGAVERTNVSTAEIMADMMVTQENYKANMSAFRTFQQLSSSTTETLLR